MYYADYKKCDFVNGTGIRNSLFCSGCNHHCKGCFNFPAWNFEFGTLYTQETEDMIIADLKNPYITGLSLLGGEPFEHTETLTKLVKRVKLECTDKNIWVWSGYTLEEILQCPSKKEMLSYCDVLVDGKFILEQRDLTLKFRGSRNQRIIDVSKIKLD